MKITVDGKEYTVEFCHQTQELQKTTICHILTEEAEIIKGWFGTAFCSKKDNFNRRIGRKIALSRALCNLFSDRAKRKEAWEAIWEARKKVCKREWSV